MNSQYQDQAAFRESFFLHRHQIREYLFPRHQGCRNPKEEGVECACGGTQCLFTHSKAGFKACAQKFTTASNRALVPSRNAAVQRRGKWGKAAWRQQTP